MNVKHRRVQYVCVAAIAVALLPALPSAALESTDNADAKLVTVDAAELEEAARNDKLSAVERSEVSEFIDLQARSGTLLDEESINVLSTEEVTVVWPDTVQIEHLDIETITYDLDGRSAMDQSIGMESIPVNDSERSTVAGMGLSMNTGGRVNGGELRGYDCVTAKSKHGNASFWGVPANSVNKLTQCYEKFKIKSSAATEDRWYYNRWATARGGKSAGWFHFKPISVSLYSRPRVNYESRVTSLNDLRLEECVEWVVDDLAREQWRVLVDDDALRGELFADEQRRADPRGEEQEPEDESDRSRDADTAVGASDAEQSLAFRR